MNQNPLQSIPPAVRATAYWISALVGLGLGAVQVGFQSAEAGFPTWLKVALSVYAFLAGALGFTAAANMPSYVDVAEGEETPPRERGAVDVVTGLLIVLLVLVILFVLGVFR